MFVLFVMSITPPHAGRSSGKDRRSRLFVNAIAPLFVRRHFVYFVSEASYDSLSSDEFSASKAWNVEGDSSCIVTRARSESFLSHYIQPIFDIKQEKSFFPFSGQAQINSLTELFALRPDLIYVDQLKLMPLVIAAQPKSPILCDFDDVAHITHLRAIINRPFYAGKLVYLMQLPAIVVAERRAIKAARLITVCSEIDKQSVGRKNERGRIAVVPNAIYAPSSIPAIPDELSILYLGTYGYEPNLQAALYMIGTIWPLIHCVHPTARLMIAGFGIEQLTNVSPPTAGVEYLGFVEDLGTLYARTRVVCCPITVGGGTRVKLIEAAAYGRPMVSTGVGAEGLEFANGSEILISESSKEFADACCLLLSDMAMCQRLGLAARQKMLHLYDAHSVEEYIRDATQEMLSECSRSNKIG